MFGSVAVSTHSINDYTSVVGQAAIDELRRLAKPLEGKRVLALSSPGASGAVRNLLHGSIPLFSDLGLDAHWQQVRVSAEFRDMDRDIRRALSGGQVEWSATIEKSLLEFNAANARVYDEDFDIVVVHHTASVGLFDAITQLTGKRPAGAWLWNSHRDYRAAVPEYWSLIRPYADQFAASIYDYKDFIRADSPTKRKVVIPPGVDPLGARSGAVSAAMKQTIMDQRGVDPNRPILAQIVLSLREDDPLRVLDTYELVKAERPDVQLVVVDLLGDAPENAQALNHLRERGRAIGDVTILTEMDRVGNVELTALRDQATVLIHQGMPRGISIELLEEMWQAKPIVSGRSPVAEAVLTHPLVGVLADTPPEQPHAILTVLNQPATGERIGTAAKDRIAQHHLITHYLAGYLKLFQQVLPRQSRRSASE
jgi:trehalose synthase